MRIKILFTGILICLTCLTSFSETTKEKIGFKKRITNHFRDKKSHSKADEQAHKGDQQPGIKLPALEEFESQLSDDTLSLASNDSQPETSEPKPHVQYDYLDDTFTKHVVNSGFRYVLVGTGWSESSMGKMNLNNQEKQKRAFALSYGQMMKIENLGGLGRLIYLTTAQISPFYRRYLYRIANQNRIRKMAPKEVEAQFKAFEKRALRVVYFSPKPRQRDAEDVTAYLKEKSNRFRQMKLPSALNALRNDIFSANHFVGFTAHFSGPFLEQLAEKWKLTYLVNPSQHAHWIKKSKSRQSFRNANVLHPRGTYEPSFTINDLVNDIYELLLQLDYKKIVLKLDQSAAGYGNKVMRFDEISNNLSEEEAKRRIRARFDDREIFPEVFIRRIEEDDGGAIIEEFIDCKNYASPASIYMINGLNDVNLRYTYDQLLGGKDNQVFKGSLGPIEVDPSYAPGDINALSLKVGKSLSEYGVRGNVGTDFVTCDIDDSEKPNRIAYAIENNVRMTGTSYPYYALSTLVGQEKIKTRFMKSFDDVKIPIIAYKDFQKPVQKDFYLSFLLKHPDALKVKSARGCIVHNDTFRLGKIGVACLGESPQEAMDMYDRFSEDIYNFVDQHKSTNEYRGFARTNRSDLLKKSLSEIEKTMQGLFPRNDLAKKRFDVIYDPNTAAETKKEDDTMTTSRPMRMETKNREFQQRFFNEYLFSHESFFNPETGHGCMINNDVFRIKQLGMVCVWDTGNKPDNFMEFFNEVSDYLFEPEADE